MQQPHLSTVILTSPPAGLRSLPIGDGWIAVFIYMEPEDIPSGYDIGRHVVGLIPEQGLEAYVAAQGLEIDIEDG